jgi:hypothetical protein
MDDTRPKAKRPLTLSPSSWRNLYPNASPTQLLLTNEQSLLLTSSASLFALHKKNCHSDAALHTPNILTEHDLAQWDSRDGGWKARRLR